MQHRTPPRGFQATSALRKGGLVLLPTANLWQMVCDARSPAAVDRLLSTCPPGPLNRPELIFPDRETLLEWFPHVHPRLDALIVYHQRPLTVLLPPPDLPVGRAGAARPPHPGLSDTRGEIAIRLARDSFCYRLCEDLEGPLAATLALGPGQNSYPSRFGRLRSDVIRAADHVVNRRQKDELGEEPAVTVRLDEEENLEFV